MKSLPSKSVVLLLILGLNYFGLLAVGQTIAYFNDIENSAENTFSAGTLDFRLTKQNVSGFVGMENNGEIFHTSVAIPESGSMPMQYFAYSTSTSPGCSEFRVRVKQNETEIFNGPLPDFLSATTTVFGTWKFEFDLPVGTFVTQGDLCQANITFSAWREEIENPEESGFFDIEILSLNLTAKTIVLNEVLAYPNSSHPYPANREFIELKNNGNAPVDVAGWKVSEMTAGGVENKYTITTASGSYTASPYGDSTIIPAGGWLVLLLSDGTALNNDGDTIRLYDSGDNKLDEYSYEAAKYGMSDARYLDGVGAWVDPIPTPGRMNVLEGEIIEVPAATPETIEVTEEPIVEPVVETEISVSDTELTDEVFEEITGDEITEEIVEEVPTETITEEVPAEPTEEIIPEVIPEIIPEIVPEVVPEEQPVIEEQPIVVEETIIEEQLAIEEQPVAVEEIKEIVPEPAPAPEPESQPELTPENNNENSE